MVTRMLILSATMALAGCNGIESGPGEFVCETDGELSERHVGVASATLHPYGDVWTLRYVDGDGALRYYRQQPGETCALETVP